MLLFNRQKEKVFPRDPDTGLIKGTEPFEFGEGRHALLFIHGWTSSPRDLRYLAEGLKDRFFCKGILLEGHGLRLEALYGTDWDGYYEQVSGAYAELRKTYAKVSLVGISYGAILALHLAAAVGPANLVLLSPFVKSRARYMGLFPRSAFIPFILPCWKNIRKIEGSAIYDPEQCAEHITYELMPARPLKSIMRPIRKLGPVLPTITCPALLMHSKEDRTADFSGSTFLLDRLGSSDKSLVVLHRSSHVITLDYERDKVEQEVRDWLVERI
jgi:carboxylesterase